MSFFFVFFHAFRFLFSIFFVRRELDLAAWQAAIFLQALLCKHGRRSSNLLVRGSASAARAAIIGTRGFVATRCPQVVLSPPRHAINLPALPAHFACTSSTPFAAPTAVVAVPYLPNE